MLNQKITMGGLIATLLGFVCYILTILGVEVVLAIFITDWLVLYPTIRYGLAASIGSIIFAGFLYFADVG